MVSWGLVHLRPSCQLNSGGLSAPRLRDFFVAYFFPRCVHSATPTPPACGRTFLPAYPRRKEGRLFLTARNTLALALPSLCPHTHCAYSRFPFGASPRFRGLLPARPTLRRLLPRRFHHCCIHTCDPTNASIFPHLPHSILPLYHTRRCCAHITALGRFAVPTYLSRKERQEGGGRREEKIAVG